MALIEGEKQIMRDFRLETSILNSYLLNIKKWSLKQLGSEND